MSERIRDNFLFRNFRFPFKMKFKAVSSMPKTFKAENDRKTSLDEEFEDSY